MESKEEIEGIQKTLFNIKADVILGKNLLQHLKDVHESLAKLELIINVAKINNELTAGREDFKRELLKLGIDILIQLEIEKHA